MRAQVARSAVAPKESAQVGQRAHVAQSAIAPKQVAVAPREWAKRAQVGQRPVAPGRECQLAGCAGIKAYFFFLDFGPAAAGSAELNLESSP